MRRGRREVWLEFDQGEVLCHNKMTSSHWDLGTGVALLHWEGGRGTGSAVTSHWMCCPGRGMTSAKAISCQAPNNQENECLVSESMRLRKVMTLTCSWEISSCRQMARFEHSPAATAVVAAPEASRVNSCYCEYCRIRRVTKAWMTNPVPLLHNWVGSLSVRSGPHSIRGHHAY